MRHSLLVATALALVLSAPTTAATQDPGGMQSVQTRQPSDPWAHLASDLPPDPAIRFGQLPNGLRYAVMHNATPPGQVSVRVRIDAGSLMEAEDQLGLAHFIEHMVFNGSNDIPEGEMVPRLERLGLSFGADTNAITSFEQTYYQLDLPNATDAKIDETLFVARQMVSEATMTNEAIDRERGIILSEERTRANTQIRWTVARWDFFYRGQLLPRRIPIGSTSVLASATREQFLRFYNAYYRPERAMVVVVGDFDVDEMERKIVGTFGDWTGVGPAGLEPDLGVVAPRNHEAGYYTEVGAPQTIEIMWSSPAQRVQDNRAARREQTLRMLGLAVLNRRLTDITRAPSAPFYQGSATRSNVYDTATQASIIAFYSSGDWRRALAAIEQEHRRIIQYGITKQEFDRAVTELRTNLTNSAAAASTESTSTAANTIIQAANRRLAHTSPVDDLAIFEELLPGISLEDVNGMLRETFPEDRYVLFMSAPTPPEGGEEAMLAALDQSKAAPVSPPGAEAEAKPWPYHDFGPAGQVVERSHVAEMDATFVRFNNGVRLTIKPTNFTDDEVRVSVRMGQGLGALPAEGSLPLPILGPVFSEGGLGQMTRVEMERSLSGRTYQSGFRATEDAFILSGDTVTQDLDLQLEVLAAYATDAAWRPEAFERAVGASRQNVTMYGTVPGGVYAQQGSRVLRSGDTRFGALPIESELDSWTLDGLKSAVAGAMSQGPLEVIIVGDVDVDEAIASVASTFGALPERPAASPISQATAPRFPEGVAEPVEFKHGGRSDQALGMIAWPTVDSISNVREARVVRLLADIMRLRLINELREAQAVTYSPQVGFNSSEVFEGYGYLLNTIELPPEKLADFFHDAERIAADLAQTPVTTDELERARLTRLETLGRTRNTNAYWVAALAGAQTDPSTLRDIQSEVTEFQSITPEDLQAAARRYLVPERAYRLQITPRNAQ